MSRKRAAFFLLPCLVSLALAFCSAAWQHGGFEHYEVEGRMPYYLSHGSLASKIYDSDYLDYGMFQARELSNFFDYLDCQFIALCVRAGHPHLLSITHYAFLLLISLIVWQFGAGDLKLPRWMALGVMLLFWTTPGVFLNGSYFRTAKIGVALALVVLYLLIFRVLRAPPEELNVPLSRRVWLVCFGWAWAATLFDLQGVFMVGIIIAFLGFWFWGYREKTALELAGPFVAAAVMSVLYNHLIAPLLTLWINGYWPDFKYQHLPWTDLLSQPAKYMGGALSIYLDAVRFLCGNIPAWGAALAMAVLAGLALARSPRHRERRGFFLAASGFFLSQTVLIWVMLMGMYLRHEALVWTDVRRGYYPIPMDAMFAMTLLLLLWRIQARWEAPKWYFAPLLGVALLGNVAGLPQNRAIERSGTLAPYIQATPALLDALKNLKNPAYVISPKIATNRVFQIFHDGYFTKTPAIQAARKSTTGVPRQPAS
ncbi:MAG TPA: hypothetical protein VGO59_00935 [Verrucomicrobiae bacterium]|jgi:hypothetical protein